jgi:hypothetical protein
MSSDRRIIVVASDWHCGHKLGLFNPETELYEDEVDGVESKIDHELSVFQEYLWYDIWLKVIDQVKRLADGDPIGLIVNGDITQGKKHPEQLVTTSIANQFLIADAALKPWADKVPTLSLIRFAFGTASHIFEEGTSPVLVSRLFKRSYPKINTAVVRHGLLDVLGMKIDYAHHGPSQGIREWTKGNQLRYYLKSVMAGYFKNGQDPPDVVYRSHYHYPHREIVSDFVAGDNGHPRTVESRIYLTPSMCGMNDYAYRATRSNSKIYNGIMVLEIENGRIVDDHLDEFVWMLDLRTEEVWE